MLKKTLPKRLLFSGYVLAATFILLEVAVRIWGYSERYIYDPIYMPFNADIPYIHKPNLVQVRSRGNVVLNTDSLGNRAKTSGLRYGPKQSNEYRIAIAGDSVTLGDGVPNTDDTFAEVLAAKLNKDQTRFQVKAFNYGVPAYSVKTMAATLRHRMFEIDPDLVIMALIGEDFDVGRTPGVDSSGYLTDAGLARINGIPSSFRWFVRRLRLAYVLRDIANQKIFRKPEVTGSVEHLDLPESYSYLREFDATARAKNVPSIVVLLPRSRDRAVSELAARQLQLDGIRFINLLYLIDQFKPEEFDASRFDPHPSAAVHKRIGALLAEHILKSITYP